MSQQRPAPVSMRGAVDLSSLARPRRAPEPPRPAAAGQAGSAAPASGAPGAGGPGAGAAGPAGAVPAETTAPVRTVVDVTDATFPSVVEVSRRVPVVVDLWAEWCGPCRQLSPVLERLAEEYGGRFLLAKVDVDANPQISAAFQVQSIPSVVAIIGGQPVPMFQGAYPEAQVRAILEELLRVAAENGVDGTLDEAVGEEMPEAPEEPPLPPLHQAAYDALENDNLDGAAKAFAQALKENPRDEEARAGLAQVDLLRRLMGIDPSTVLALAARASHADVEAHLAAADVEVASGRSSAALDRLVSTVRATRGAERERVRLRLLELFDVVGSATPEVTAARRALANALY